ncbi:hypothetical protein OESDEN_02240 [Oesophagostomum dentatum]|uniref:Uncharacterized protein n=1 Tax=Oesophagostomum dentatum TaxID=61180 RepID=A0A0B1TQU9_OESDE|nr:hypothetical protein OESDEN_02240 [Oesophagostomum dentatum]
MQNCNNAANVQKTKPSQPPTKTVLQLLDRSSRTSTANAPPEVDPLRVQPQNERPAYARRFMLNRLASDTNAPLRRPSYDDGLTPVFPADEEFKEIPRFVLPPLP